MAIDLNGIAHIQLTVNDPARCVPFWEKLCHFFGMQTLISGADIVYCIGSRTGILVRGAPTDGNGGRFDQHRAGLHHFCFRARSREDVDAVHRFLVDELAAHIVHPPEDGGFAPGYYSVLFEDPDGIRVEVNHVPGKGHLGPGGRLGDGGDGPADRFGTEGLKRGGDEPGRFMRSSLFATAMQKSSSGAAGGRTGDGSYGRAVGDPRPIRRRHRVV